ncbi:hypothetical protein ACQ86G_12605 [Roseateles chitinivorans]|uniref:hypothetical protein n=1 Tax=Roseateles chitinivorans TaxID=2917965 RepID=UPI003D66E46C
MPIVTVTIPSPSIATKAEELLEGLEPFRSAGCARGGRAAPGCLLRTGTGGVQREAGRQAHLQEHAPAEATASGRREAGGAGAVTGLHAGILDALGQLTAQVLEHGSHVVLLQASAEAASLTAAWIRT